MYRVDLFQASASYFLGDQNNASLQRVYGVSYPNKKLLAERLTFLEEAAKRDHRKIGLAQELFFFDESSPGSPFLLTHGMRIFNTLQAFVRDEYHRRDYQEVSSPNMFSSELWKTSGHWGRESLPINETHYGEGNLMTVQITKTTCLHLTLIRGSLA